MKELDLVTVLTVLHDILGSALFFGLPALAALGIVAFVTTVVRERGLRARRLLISQVLGVVGGVLACCLMTRVAASGTVSPNGAADWLLFATVFGLGLAGSTILFYGVIGWFSRKSHS